MLCKNGEKNGWYKYLSPHYAFGNKIARKFVAETFFCLAETGLGFILRSFLLKMFLGGDAVTTMKSV